MTNLQRADGRTGPELDMETPHNKTLAWSKFLAWLAPADNDACKYCFAQLVWSTGHGYVHQSGGLFCDPGGSLGTTASPTPHR